MHSTGPKTTTTVRTIPCRTAQFIAKASNYSRWERACDAALWVRGELDVRPTVKLSASVFGVTPARVTSELKAIKAAEQRLNAASNGTGNGHAIGNGHAEPSLAERLLSATAAERQQAAEVIGVAAVWDDMIAPLVGNNGHAAE